MQAGEKELPNWSYVGAQGPLRLTVADFWLMIAEKECRVIVMLTKCLEGSENKCEPYFPQQRGDELQARFPQPCLNETGANTLPKSTPGKYCQLSVPTTRLPGCRSQHSVVALEPLAVAESIPNKPCLCRSLVSK